MNKTALMESQTKEKAAEKAMKRIREEKTRRKDDKSVDHVLKALDSLGTTEEKLGAMCQKYAEMFNDHRLLQNAVKQAEKKNTVLQKEKEQLQAEHSKAILTRSRLENLCRELQRQNKAVKEECMLKMREEGEKKREVAAKFHSMLSEIGSLLAQNSDKNAKLRDDNLDMSMRLKSVCDQFEKKEQHVENLAKQMQLEMQLADAKLAKAKMEMDIEKETLQKEKQQLLIELAEYKRKVCEMKASELALREQITMYSEKYEEFHKALLQSNSAIGDFKAEMERMTKHIRRLEKETATWKSRYDAAQRTLAEVTEGKIRSDEALGLSIRRLTALQGICRGLQDQCRQLRGEKKGEPLSEEEYQRLEAQIKEATTDSPKSPVLSIESSKTTDDIITNIKNDNELLNSADSISTSEEVAVACSGLDGEENEIDNKVTESENVSLEQESITTLVIQENSAALANTNCDEKKENRLSEGSIEEDSSSKSNNEEKPINGNDNIENGDIQNDLPKLISCDSSVPECTTDENIVENPSQKTTNSLTSSVKALDLDKSVESHIVDNNVPNLPNITEDYAPKESLSEKSLKDVEETVLKIDTSDRGDSINILREDIPLDDKVSNQLNGDVLSQNLNNSSDEIQVENSRIIQEVNSDKTLSSPEDASQSKSKKKRKMKK
ncbi:gamma-taxilin [Halyomorpha halys]|uniref:gamma-taxilin n=1 Tax=Halyomorpha halys TaxID=286706 RepID=UPI0006D4DE34|nr:gamma-taxilin [Halyomorpha halys]